MPTSTVVAVDDTQVDLALYERLLRRVPKVRLVQFLAAVEGLDWCKKHDFDLLLIDFHMPVLNGLEFVDRLRNRAGKRDVPIVMATIAREKEIRYRAIDLGVNDFLVKPVDPIEFVARVKNLLLLRDRGRRLADRADRLTEEVQRATGDIAEREEETIDRLVRAAEYRDASAGNHVLRVARYADELAGALGLSTEDRRLIRLAAPMHDVGKVAIPQRILQKPGELAPDERADVERHAAEGYELLHPGRSKLLALAAEIAYGHHERWDGTGYPRSLRGEDIPLAARIVALCDVYDALVSDRPHKRAWSADEAAAYVEGASGTQFDPMVVAGFVAVRDRFAAIRRTLADDATVVA